MKKKLLALVLILALVATLCVALVSCNNTAKEFKIGVLHINPLDSTSGYTHAHQQGILQAKAALGLTDTQIIYKDSLPDDKAKEINDAIEGFIAEGCTMIIGTSFGYGQYMLPYAEKHPEIIFSHGTGYLDTMGEGKNNNMNTYFGRIYQARYLSGIVAGLKTKTNNIGYVSAFGTTVAETCSGINAFALGVQSVNPDAVVHVKTLGAWFHPANEGQYAKDLMEDYNCDVITQHCDTENPSSEAKLANKYSIGYNSDMAVAVKNAGEARNASVLTSVVWNWGVYYKAAIEAAMKCFNDKGEFVSTDSWKALGNYYEGIDKELFGLTELSTEANADTAAIVGLAKAQLVGKVEGFDVFTNKALKFDKVENVWQVSKIDRTLLNDSDTAIDAVTDAVIQGSMSYWVKGVVAH